MKNYRTFLVALFALSIAACGTTTKTSTPSDTLMKFVDAFDRKDVATIKQTFSKGTIKMYDEAARRQNISTDDLIKRQFAAPLGGSLSSNLQVVAEKIEGDRATVEVKSPDKPNNEKLPLVKEDGEWKLAYDEYAEALRNRYLEDMNKPLSNTAK